MKKVHKKTQKCTFLIPIENIFTKITYFYFLKKISLSIFCKIILC